MSWYVYLLHCADDTFYTGVTTDPQRRLNEHNHNNKKSARYTRSRRPLKMVYLESCETRSVACVREYQVRKLSRQQKQQLASEAAHPLLPIADA